MSSEQDAPALHPDWDVTGSALAASAPFNHWTLSGGPGALWLHREWGSEVTRNSPELLHTAVVVEVFRAKAFIPWAPAYLFLHDGLHYAIFQITGPQLNRTVKLIEETGIATQFRVVPQLAAINFILLERYLIRKQMLGGMTRLSSGE